MSFSISLKKFRETIDQIENPRDSALIKTAYLLAARNSEICSETTPFDMLHNASKPYGNFLKYEMKDFEVEPAVGKEEAIVEKALVITSAVAKRGKKIKRKTDDSEKPTEVSQQEIVEAFTKFGQVDLLDKIQSGEIAVDPLLIKILLGKIFLKVIALPISTIYEPWTYDILKHIQRNKGVLSFPITRSRLWQILRKSIGSILQKRDVHNVKNPLRHFRISHLIEYYQMEPFELTSIAGWTAASTFSQMGISASSQLDHYAHLSWRRYFPKLLKPLEKLM